MEKRESDFDDYFYFWKIEIGKICLKNLIKICHLIKNNFKKMSKCMLGCIKNYDKYLEDVVEKDGVFATKL